MSKSPNENSNKLINYTIKVDGTAIKLGVPISSVFIEKSFQYDKAQVRIHEGLQDAFSICESKDFTPGRTIEILLGYEKDETSVFKGMISAHGITMISQVPTLTLFCSNEKQLEQDSAYKEPVLSVVYGTDVLDFDMTVNTSALKKGSVTFQGYPLLPGNVLALDGFGTRFDGNVSLTAIEHHVFDSMWTTKAEW